MVEYWKDQEDATDTGVPIDSDYVEPSAGDVTVGYDPERPVPDGGIDLSAEGNESDAYKDDEYAVQKSPDGFAHTTKARTTKLGSEDYYGNECRDEEVWERGGPRWRIQMGLPTKMLGERCDGCEHCDQDDCLEDCEDGCPVCREWCYNDTWEWVAGAEIDNKERNRLTALDSYLDCFNVADPIREKVKAKVLDEDTSRYWNRHYAGIEGAVVGFMAVELANSPGEALEDERLHSDRVTALVEDVGKPLEMVVEHGFKRARENGWIGGHA